MVSKDIQYYGQTFAAEQFKAFGLRGKWIVFLNWVRYVVSFKLEFHVMRCLQAQGLDQPIREAYEDEKRSVFFKNKRPAPTIIDPVTLVERDLTPQEASAERLKRLIAEGRSKRYARGRRVYIMSADDTFDSVESEHAQDHIRADSGKDSEVAGAESSSGRAEVSDGAEPSAD